jgi:hypothetical protein
MAGESSGWFLMIRRSRSEQMRLENRERQANACRNRRNDHAGNFGVGRQLLQGVDDIGRRSAEQSRRIGGAQGQTVQTRHVGKLYGGRRRADRADAPAESRQNGDAGDRSLGGAAPWRLADHRHRKNDAGETMAQ